MEKYRINYYIDDQPVGAMFSSFYLMVKNDTLILSNSGSNELYFYNLKTDSLSSKAYSNQYTSFEITKSFPERVDSEEEYRNLVQETRKNVHYGSLIFDGQQNVYWRFSKEMDRMKGDTLIYIKMCLQLLIPNLISCMQNSCQKGLLFLIKHM